MRDTNQLDNFYDELKRIHKYVPNWRFGQFMINFMSWYYNQYKRDCFYAEDDKIIKSIEEFIDEVRGSL